MLYEIASSAPGASCGVIAVASHDGRDGSVTISQDVDLFTGSVDGNPIRYNFAPNRYGWLQVTQGEIELNGQKLAAGDGAAIENEKMLSIGGQGDLLLFDLN